MDYNCTASAKEEYAPVSLIGSVPYVTNDSKCYLDGKACTEWTYDKSVFQSTIISEWDLVCGNKELADLAQTVFMLGVLVGSVLFGLAADK